MESNRLNELVHAEYQGNKACVQKEICLHWKGCAHAQAAFVCPTHHRQLLHKQQLDDNLLIMFVFQETVILRLQLRSRS